MKKTDDLATILNIWLYKCLTDFFSIYKNDYLKEFDDILDIVENRTGLTFYYNYLLSQQPEEFSNYPKFLEKPEVRRSIHVGNLTYDDVSLVVHEHLFDDMSKTIRPWLETLLESNYKVHYT